MINTSNVYITWRYACRHCDRKFSHTSERKDHETVHTGERPYMCPICGESYRRNANLWRHKRRYISGWNIILTNTDTGVKAKKGVLKWGRWKARRWKRRWSLLSVTWQGMSWIIWTKRRRPNIRLSLLTQVPVEEGETMRCHKWQVSKWWSPLDNPNKSQQHHFWVSDTRMVEWKLAEEWAGGWWGVICPTSILGWEIQMKRWPIIFSLQGGCPPEQHQPCSEGNMPDRLLLVDQFSIFNFTQNTFPAISSPTLRQQFLLSRLLQDISTPLTFGYGLVTSN